MEWNLLLTEFQRRGRLQWQRNTDALKLARVVGRTGAMTTTTVARILTAASRNRRATIAAGS